MVKSEIDMLGSDIAFSSNSILTYQNRYGGWLTPGRSVTTAEIQLTWDEVKELQAEVKGLRRRWFSLPDDEDKTKAELGESLTTLENSVFSILVKVGEIHRKRMESNKAATDALGKSSPFRLERLSVPKFNGRVEEWQDFEDLFKSAVSSNPGLSDADKIAYLKQALTGDASSIVSRFPTTNSSFDEAWDLVVKRYSNLREIVFAHMRKFFDLHTVSDSATGLRQLCDVINECVRSLKNLKVPVEHWDLVFVFVALQKMDPMSRKEWLLVQGSDLPKLPKFLEFFETRATALADSHSKKSCPKVKSESKSDSKSANFSSGVKPTSPSASNVQPTASGSSTKCDLCGESHFLFQCSTFRKLNVKERLDFVRKSHRCFNCFRKSCSAEKCDKDKCKKCSKPHHTMLHFEPKNQNTTSTHQSTNEATSGSQLDSTSQSPSVGQTSSGHCSPENISAHVVLMETVLVDVLDSHGDKQQCRVFLDSGSESHFVSEQCVDRLGLPREKTCVNICGIGGATAETSRGLVTLKIFSHLNNYSVEFKALVLKKVTGSKLPRSTITSPLDYLGEIELADSSFASPGPVDILIGAPLIIEFSRPGIIRAPKGFPSARNTVFGWVLSGLAPSESSASNYVQVLHSRCSKDDRCIDSALKKFWELEEPCAVPQPTTKEDEQCEKWFRSSVQKLDSGEYSIGLPFVSDFSGLGSSRAAALRRLASVEKSMAKIPEMQISYHQQFREYISKGWLVTVPVSDLQNTNSYYMPHHVVTKEDSTTTKYRIVFDASAKSSNGLSLNNVLHTGPKLQVDLVPLLLNFRTHIIAMSADITKFYNCFSVHSDDSNYQRLLYRPSPVDPVMDMKMTRVTFGVAPAPFLAIRCLHQLADDNFEKYPTACQVIKKEFLVDNLLSGAPSVDEAIQLQQELLSVMRIGKLELRKWTSNSSIVVSSVSSESQAKSQPLEITEDGTVKTIGLLWNPSLDTFSVKLNSNLHSNSTSKFPGQIPVVTTKRKVLSSIARIFDPLGWLSPVIIRPKILMQKLWKANLDWDSPLPDDLLDEWYNYTIDIVRLNSFFVPRCVVHSNLTSTEFELHGFCDASISAYSACVYLKVFSSTVPPIVNLLCAKTCVAPVKGETIPRLELCGAVLLAKLMTTVISSVQLHISSINCWCDSTCVLNWINSDKKLDVFVHNRVRKILSLLPSANWHHVDGDENPADCASRGITVFQFLKHPLWLHGPEWLQKSAPMATTNNTSQVVTPSNWFFETVGAFIQKCDSFQNMKRYVAVWIRYINNLHPNSESVIGPLTVKELDQALIILVRCVQSETFASELDWCKRKKTSPSTVKSLTPFIDANGILRVGGRLRHSFWSYDQKHPILLPRHHHFTICIVRHLHQSNNHPGPQLLLSLVRDKFWIPNGPKVCSSVVRKCITCHKVSPKVLGQKMGQLPMSRVTPTLPFTHVGVDYAGAFHVNATPGRNPRLLKAYVAVFVCLAVKAIHLEFVSDLSTPAFLSAFDRLVSTRGCPSKILCDGGRNFLGAKNEIEEFQQFVTSTSHVDQVSKFFVDQNVEFVINPPYAPHFGGIFEAGVKSMKTHLHRVAGDRRLSIEEFWTLLKRIEATLNSRPLTPMSSDANDFSALTPGHFLIGRSLKAAPQENLDGYKVHQLTRWQHVQQMAQHFNRRWSSQYLQSLQKTPKWFAEQENLGVGTLVLLNDSDSDLGPQKWTLGRIAAVNPGKDNLVRVCDVNVPVTDAKGNVTIKTYNRPIVKVSPLPIDDGTYTYAYKS